MNTINGSLFYHSLFPPSQWCDLQSNSPQVPLRCTLNTAQLPYIVTMDSFIPETPFTNMDDLKHE